MNKWRITWVFNGSREDIINADTLEGALRKFREQYPFIPGIALEAIVCFK